MSINYVIATYNGKCKRKHIFPKPEQILIYHISKILELNNNLSQITIMKAQSTNYYENYYNLDEIIYKSNIPIKIIECENFGYSEGQWMKCYEIYRNKFDYYLFMEDDYCPNINNFDKLLIEIYNKKFIDSIGLLCSLVQGSKNYNLNKFPIHFEGCVFINNKTLSYLYNHPKWEGNPRKYLDLIDINIDPKFNWDKIKNSYIGGYYQLTFSHLFNLIGIEHEDYLDYLHNNNILCFPYWDDNSKKSIGGEIFFYKKGDIKNKKYTLAEIKNSPIIPIQLCNNNFIFKNTYLKKKIVFIIGMHRCGTSLLGNCFVENGFSIGINKNKDLDNGNPNGYFENDNFTKFHERLLKLNNSSWLKINSENMNYDKDDIKNYRILIEKEFINDYHIIIKDPRLTFFINFLKEVCEGFYDYYFIFCIRNKKECCTSLSKLQKVKYEDCEILYENTLNKYSKNFLKIDYKEQIYNNDETLNKIMKFINFNNKIYSTKKIINYNLYRNKF